MVYAEKLLFERDLGVNPELSAELNLTMTIDDAINREDILDLRRKLRVISRKNETETLMIPKPTNRRMWYAAASLVLLATLGTALYFLTNRDYTNEMLFKQYYSTDNYVSITRSSEANIVEAIIKFQQKEYKDAAVLFNQLLQRDANNSAAWFYYGICCMETKEYLTAEASFNHVIHDRQNLYSENAEWLLSLCYLKVNQIGMAKKQLQQIASNLENAHQGDAKQLLNRISL